jgi:D-alanine-D-alanine ligase-like ATP-grasp enzyme
MAIRKVLVLFGGVSTEHVISLRSAFNIVGGLRRAGYSVQCTGIAQNGDWLAFTGPDEAILDGSWEKNGQGTDCRPIASPRAFAA